MAKQCSIDGCPKSHYARSWCESHYKLWRKYGDPLFSLARQRLVPTPCTVEECKEFTTPKSARGLCPTHYSRWQRTGDAGEAGSREPTRGMPAEERFWLKVDKNGPLPASCMHLGRCWLFTGAPTRDGCGRFDSKGALEGGTLPYRISWVLANGPVPDGLKVTHLCEHQSCVNPDHLELTRTPKRRAPRRPRAICSLDDCDEHVDGNGYCKFHNTRFKRTGDPYGLKGRAHLVRPVLDRLMDRVDLNGPTSPYMAHLGPCWLVMSKLDSQGYASIYSGGEDGRRMPAHQVTYEAFIGPVPDGLELDHICHSLNPDCLGGPACVHRRCVNPWHLEPVTHEENVRRGNGGRHQRDRTHCPQGHEYDEANTKWTKDGRRDCRECARERSLAYYYRTRTAKKPRKHPVS